MGILNLGAGCQVIASQPGRPYVSILPVDNERVWVEWHEQRPDAAMITAKHWPASVGDRVQYTVVPGVLTNCSDLSAITGGSLNPVVVKFPSMEMVCPVPGQTIDPMEQVTRLTVVPISPLKLCDKATNAGELQPGDKVVVCIDGDGNPYTKTVPADENTRYRFAVVNDYNGDGIIQIEVTATETDGSTSTRLIEITETEREEGQYFSGQPTLTGGTGLLSFPVVNDEGEGAAPPMVVNLEAWLQNQVVGSGDTTVTWDGDKFVVFSDPEDLHQTVIPNPDGSTTFQLVDEEGNKVGNPMTIPPDTRNTVTSSDGSVSITATGQPDGSLNYDLRVSHPTYRLKITDPVDGNGVIAATLTGSDGSTSVIEWPEPTRNTDTFGKIVNNGNGTFTWTSADGTVTETWATDTTISDTFGKIVNNGNGTFTWTSADGNQVHTWATDTTIPDTNTFVTFKDNGNGSYTFTSADGSNTMTITLPAAGTADTDTINRNYQVTTNADGSHTVTYDVWNVVTNTRIGEGSFVVPDATGSGPGPVYKLKDACSGADLPTGSKVVTQNNPVAPGSVWMGGKGSGNGNTAVNPGVEIVPNYNKAQIFGGAGQPAHISGNSVVLDKTGLWLPFIDAGMAGEPGYYDPQSVYRFDMFINGTFHNRTDVDMTGTVVHPSGTVGEDTDKPLKRFIGNAGDVITYKLYLHQGNGGHKVSKMFVTLQYEGCAQQYV